MKMMYSSQFRLYSGVRRGRGSILFYLLSVLKLPGAGGFPPPRLWTPNNSRRRSLGAFGASASSPTAFFSSTTVCY